MNPSNMDSSERLWTLAFIGLTLSNLFLFLNLQMITPALPAYVADTFGQNDLMVSLVISLFALSAIVSRMFAGRLLDTVGRKNMLVIGLAIYTLSTAGYYWMGTISAFLAMRVLFGIGFGIVGTAYGTMVADTIPARRLGEGMGYFGLSTSLSMSIAPVIGIWLLTEHGFPTLIVVSSAVVLLCFFLFPLLRGASTLPAVRSADSTSSSAAVSSNSAEAEEHSMPVTSAESNSSWLDRAALFPCSLSLLLSVTYGGLITFITLFGIEAGIANVGWFFLFNAMMLVLVRPVAGRIFDRYSHRVIIPIGTVLTGIGLVLLSYAHGMPMLIAAALCYGAGYGSIQPSLQAWTIQRVKPERRAIATGLFYNSIDLGIAIGSLALGAIVSFVSYGAMYRWSALTMLVLLAVYGLMSWKEAGAKADRKSVIHDHLAG